MSDDYSWAITLGVNAKDSWMREPEIVRRESGRDVGMIFSAIVLGVEHSMYVDLLGRAALDVEIDITCGLKQMRMNARRTVDRLLPTKPCADPDDDAPSPSEALFAFAAWLTTRSERSGPFSEADDAGPAATLVAEFCESQGFDEPRDGWTLRLKDYPK